jgi:hypothetical protein
MDQSHELFWSKFNYTYCKLDHFINTRNICCSARKRSRLQKRVSKFKKSFVRLTLGYNISVLISTYTLKIFIAWVHAYDEVM